MTLLENKITTVVCVLLSPQRHLFYSRSILIKNNNMALHSICHRCCVKEDGGIIKSASRPETARSAIGDLFYATEVYRGFGVTPMFFLTCQHMRR